MQGFVVLDYADRFMEAIMQLSQWIRAGKIKHNEDIV
jgi:NADPH-dependent curcumin reductase CurA